MGFSKAKKVEKPAPAQDSLEFNFMGEIKSENEDNEESFSIGENNNIDQSRSRTRLAVKYKTTTIVIDAEDKHVPFEAKDQSLIKH